MILVTREQLRVCGELTDYSHNEIEALIVAAIERLPFEAGSAEIYAAVLEEMRADHRRRAVDQFKRSLGAIR